MILIACASFKGTLTSREAGEAIARGLCSRGLDARVVALADGGEGLVEALASQTPGARLVQAPCCGPLGEPREAQFVLLPMECATAGLSAEGAASSVTALADKPPVAHIQSAIRNPQSAIVEMAASSGLTLVPAARRDPKFTTTLGVGDQIRAALDALWWDGRPRPSKRARTPVPPEILLGLGGSATNDGGAGMAQALGARLLDKHGRELEAGGAALLNLARIDVSALDSRLKATRVIAACDVRNPLCGRQGASAVFGPQKGATPADVRLLDKALAHFAEIIRRDLGVDVAQVPGAGAAGGLGAGCIAFLKAELKPGIELVLDALQFDALLKDAALVITGEGRLNAQTLMGKAPAGVAARAKKAGVKCVAIGGSVSRQDAKALRETFDRVESLSEFAGSRQAAAKEAARWLEELAKARIGGWTRLNFSTDEHG